LNKLWRALKVEGSAEQSRKMPHVEPGTTAESEPETMEDCPLEKLYKSKDTSHHNAARRAVNSIDLVINSFLSEPRLDQQENILKYWHPRS